MALRILNPNWKSADRQKAETHAPAVSAWLAANAGNRLVGLPELRAGLPTIAADLKREVVNEICAILSLEVQGADDPAA
jgi:hypothetical protein